LKLGVLMGSMLSGMLGALILVRASALKRAP
jgi:Na+/H+ antiporter NhaA